MLCVSHRNFAVIAQDTYSPSELLHRDRLPRSIGLAWIVQENALSYDMLFPLVEVDQARERDGVVSALGVECNVDKASKHCVQAFDLYGMS